MPLSNAALGGRDLPIGSSDPIQSQSNDQTHPTSFIFSDRNRVTIPAISYYYLAHRRRLNEQSINGTDIPLDNTPIVPDDIPFLSQLSSLAFEFTDFVLDFHISAGFGSRDQGSKIHRCRFFDVFTEDTFFVDSFVVGAGCCTRTSSRAGSRFSCSLGAGRRDVAVDVSVDGFVDRSTAAVA